MKCPRVVLVIPCYGNEPIYETLGMIENSGRSNIHHIDLSVLVVATPDKTGFIPNLEELRKSYNRTEMVVEYKRGYGRAYKTGLTNASERSDYIITADADGTYPVNEISKIMEFVLESKCNFYSGCRFVNRNRDSFSLINYIGNLFFTELINKIFNLNFRDSQSGMWIMHSHLVPSILSYRLGEGMEFSSQIKIIAKMILETNFQEIGITYSSRLRGKSRISWFTDGFRIFTSIIKFRSSINKRIKHD